MFEFCLPATGTKVPASPEWLHEIKFDGYRLRVERNGERVRLMTRGGYDWTKRFPLIVEAALKNLQKHFVIDGEAVILGVDGYSDFKALHSRASVYWRLASCLCSNQYPLPLRTQLIVLHDVVGAFGRRFFANADSKPPTHSAAMAQQTRLTAPRNVSSLKLRHLPDLNILAPAQTRYLQKSLNRRCGLSSPALRRVHHRQGPPRL
jgi:ATP dependent DNA ligase domain